MANIGVKENYRPGLRIKPEIVERERKFNSEDSDREKWMLNHTYLCKGGLEELKHHPDWNQSLLEDTLTYYPDYERHREVVVRIKKGSGNRKANIKEAEKSLKRALFRRGCNAGIHYKISSKGSYMIGKAVPAYLDQAF